MYPTQQLLLAIGLALLLGCASSDSRSARVTNAEISDTPVQYIFCASINADCIVTARFNDLNSCESYKRYRNMLCDKSNSDTMTCKTAAELGTSATYCRE